MKYHQQSIQSYGVLIRYDLTKSVPILRFASADGLHDFLDTSSDCSLLGACKKLVFTTTHTYTSLWHGARLLFPYCQREAWQLQLNWGETTLGEAARVRKRKKKLGMPTIVLLDASLAMSHTVSVEQTVQDIMQRGYTFKPLCLTW